MPGPRTETKKKKPNTIDFFFLVSKLYVHTGGEWKRATKYEQKSNILFALFFPPSLVRLYQTSLFWNCINLHFLRFHHARIHQFYSFNHWSSSNWYFGCHFEIFFVVNKKTQIKTGGKTRRNTDYDEYLFTKELNNKRRFWAKANFARKKIKETYKGAAGVHGVTRV